MSTTTLTRTNWIELTRKLGKKFEERASEADLSGQFVFENYQDLKNEKFFSLMVPEEFGGAGLSHSEVCDIIRRIAHYCGSTALAFSMHQHLVAAAVWKYNTKGEGAPLLQKVAEEQIVLVSTGARDWLDSNGTLTKADGGYLFSARKHFASQSIGGDIAITSAPFTDRNGEKRVLHFPVPLNLDRVNILDDWDVMGMRATGSQTIEFDQVFIPEEKIALDRSAGEFHPVWDVVITVAMPLIMSAYIGIAEEAFEVSRSIGKKYHRNQGHNLYIFGKLFNTLMGARAQWESMVKLANDLDFTPNNNNTIQTLSLKTNVADESIRTVAEAMEAIGGQSFYRKNKLERLFRDVQAAQFHPLPKWDQYKFVGERLFENFE